MDKKQIMKRSLLIGVGLAAHAKSKAECLAKELVKKNHIKPDEGKKLVAKIYREAEASGKRVAKVLEAELNKTIKLVAGSAAKRKSKSAKKKR